MKSVQERRNKSAASKSQANFASGGGDAGGRGAAGRGAGARTPKGKPETTEPTIATKKMNSDVVRVLAKVAPLKFSMEAAMKRDKVSQVPKVHRKKMKQLIGELRKLETAAQDTVSNQKVLKLEMDEVPKTCKEAQSHWAVFRAS